MREALGGKRGTELCARRAYDVRIDAQRPHIVDMAATVANMGCLQTFEIRNPIAQSPAYVLAPVDMVVDLAQLLDADCGAQLAQPIVEPDHVGEIEVGLCRDDALGVV